MPNNDRTFSEAEHQALLQGAVEREVAAAVKDRDDSISELEQRIDVLEAEKASAVQAKEELQGEFDSYKADVERAKEIEARKAERVERVKAAAIHLPDDYFTHERSQRWAEMADEQFTALVEDFEAAAVAGLTKEEAKQLEGLKAEERASKLIELRAQRQERASETPVRETAAFGGGQEPTSDTKTSAVGDFFAARRGGVPATTK